MRTKGHEPEGMHRYSSILIGTLAVGGWGAGGENRSQHSRNSSHLVLKSIPN